MIEVGLLVSNVKLDLVSFYVAKKCYEAFATGENKIYSEFLIGEIGLDLSKAAITSSMKKLERFGFLEFTHSKGEYMIQRGENFQEIVSGGKVEMTALLVKDKPQKVDLKETLEQRRREFWEYLWEENEKQDKKKLASGSEGMLEKFFLYWSEADRSTGLMKWENKKEHPTWEAKKRLGTWYSNAVQRGEIIVMNL
jgi:hypothetical protein